MSWTGVGTLAFGSVAVYKGSIAISSAAALGKNIAMFAKTSKQSGKETASDAPGWSKSQKPLKGETAERFTRRILNNKYGNDVV